MNESCFLENWLLFIILNRIHFINMPFCGSEKCFTLLWSCPRREERIKEQVGLYSKKRDLLGQWQNRVGVARNPPKKPQDSPTWGSPFLNMEVGWQEHRTAECHHGREDGFLLSVDWKIVSTRCFVTKKDLVKKKGMHPSACRQTWQATCALWPVCQDGGAFIDGKRKLEP